MNSHLSHLNESSLVIAPWCEHCHDLYPEFEAAADILSPENPSLGRVDCAADKALCQQCRVPIYPTIRVFHGSRSNQTIYNGKRRADEIVSFLRRHEQPALTTLDSASDAAQFSTKDKVTFIGYLDDGHTSYQTFKSLAETERDRYLFGYTSDPDFGSAEKIQKPAIVAYKAFDDRRIVYKGPFDSKTLQDFVHDAAMPYIHEIGKDIAQAKSTQRPMAIILASGTEQILELKTTFWPIAKESRGRILWVIVDPDKHPEYALRLGMRESDTSWPAFGIEDASNDFKYVLPTSNFPRLNPAMVRVVVDQFLNKRLSSNTDGDFEVTVGKSWTDPGKKLEDMSGGVWKVRAEL